MIDIHSHMKWLGKTIPDAAAHFRSIGVTKAVALGWEDVDRAHAGEYELPTEDALQAAADFPDLFIPFCSVDPRRGNIEARIRDYASRGCKGFGEHKVRVCIDNPDSKRIYRMCAELGWVCLFHMDVPLPDSDMWYNVDVSRLPALLREFPTVVFIGHGPGFWREISGDADARPEAYPEGPVTPGGRLIRILEDFDNLHCDISAGSGHNALTRDPDFGRNFIITYRDRLLYGTDQFDTKHIDMLRAYDLPQDVFDAVTRRNAEGLLGVQA
jgi:hypothetical protein